jgi:hypothetical protein
MKSPGYDDEVPRSRDPEIQDRRTVEIVYTWAVAAAAVAAIIPSPYWSAEGSDGRLPRAGNGRVMSASFFLSASVACGDCTRSIASSSEFGESAASDGVLVTDLNGPEIPSGEIYAARNWVYR